MAELAGEPFDKEVTMCEQVLNYLAKFVANEAAVSEEKKVTCRAGGWVGGVGVLRGAQWKAWAWVEDWLLAFVDWCRACAHAREVGGAWLQLSLQGFEMRCSPFAATTHPQADVAHLEGFKVMQKKEATEEDAWVMGVGKKAGKGGKGKGGKKGAWLGNVWPGGLRGAVWDAVKAWSAGSASGGACLVCALRPAQPHLWMPAHRAPAAALQRRAARARRRRAATRSCRTRWTSWRPSPRSSWRCRCPSPRCRACWRRSRPRRSTSCRGVCFVGAAGCVCMCLCGWVGVQERALGWPGLGWDSCVLRLLPQAWLRGMLQLRWLAAAVGCGALGSCWTPCWSWALVGAPARHRRSPFEVGFYVPLQPPVRATLLAPRRREEVKANGAPATEPLEPQPEGEAEAAGVAAAEGSKAGEGSKGKGGKGKANGKVELNLDDESWPSVSGEPAPAKVAPAGGESKWGSDESGGAAAAQVGRLGGLGGRGGVSVPRARAPGPTGGRDMWQLRSQRAPPNPRLPSLAPRAHPAGTRRWRVGVADCVRGGHCLPGHHRPLSAASVRPSGLAGGRGGRPLNEAAPIRQQQQREKPTAAAGRGRCTLGSGAVSLARRRLSSAAVRLLRSGVRVRHNILARISFLFWICSVPRGVAPALQARCSWGLSVEPWCGGSVL